MTQLTVSQLHISLLVCVLSYLFYFFSFDAGKLFVFARGFVSWFGGVIAGFHRD